MTKTVKNTAKAKKQQVMPRKPLVIKEPNGLTIHPTEARVQDLRLRVPVNLSSIIAGIAVDAAVTPETVIRVLLALGMLDIDGSVAVR